MSAVVVAYIPVLHEGYHRFLTAHASGGRIYVVGRDLHEDYRPLAKDIRALDPSLVASAIEAWGIADQVRVLDHQGALALAKEAPQIVLPAEDVSHHLVDRFFSRCPVLYDSVFLRWDRPRSARLEPPRPVRHIEIDDPDPALAELIRRATDEAERSADWWRHVGAALLLSDGRLLSAHNQHLPHSQSAYVAGDPRANFHRGVNIELSTATHAEARLIARAARDGLATAGATLYVTDFPCPPCAKLIAGAGIKTLYYSEGYAMLDGADVLDQAGVGLVQVRYPSYPGG